MHWRLLVTKRRNRSNSLSENRAILRGSEMSFVLKQFVRLWPYVLIVISSSGLAYTFLGVSR